MRKVSVIIPTTRPAHLKRCLEFAKKNAGVPDDAYEIITLEDHHRIGCPAMVSKMTKMTTYDLVCFVGDDCIPQENWLKNALEAMELLPDGWGVVAFKTTYGGKDYKVRFAGHWLADKRMLPLLGGDFFHPNYKHGMCDYELTEIAHEHGRFFYSEKAMIDNPHPYYNEDVPDDEIYRKGYCQETQKHDYNLFVDRKLERGKKHLGIGLPIIDDRVHTQFMLSFLAMEKPDCVLLTPEFANGEFLRDVAVARNSIVRQAKWNGCTHLVMLDTDQIYPPDTIAQLMSHDKDCVTGAVHRRYPPFDLIFQRGSIGNYIHVPDEESYSGDLIEIDATGCACMLFNMKIFATIKEPWFEFSANEKGNPVGEDINFCQKMRDHGYKIHADTSIAVDHLTNYRVNRLTYELHKKFHKYEWRN